MDGKGRNEREGNLSLKGQCHQIRIALKWFDCKGLG